MFKFVEGLVNFTIIGFFVLIGGAIIYNKVTHQPVMVVHYKHDCKIFVPDSTASPNDQCDADDRTTLTIFPNGNALCLCNKDASNIRYIY
jgi:hypothetical protein